MSTSWNGPVLTASLEVAKRRYRKSAGCQMRPQFSPGLLGPLRCPPGKSQSVGLRPATFARCSTPPGSSASSLSADEVESNSSNAPAPGTHANNNPHRRSLLPRTATHSDRTTQGFSMHSSRRCGIYRSLVEVAPPPSMDSGRIASTSAMVRLLSSFRKRPGCVARRACSCVALVGEVRRCLLTYCLQFPSTTKMRSIRATRCQVACIALAGEVRWCLFAYCVQFPSTIKT